MLYDRPLRLQDHEIEEARRLLADLRGLANPRPSFLYDRYLANEIADLDQSIRTYERAHPSTSPWVDINDGIDRQRDFDGPFFGQAGPDGPGWSWTLLRATDGDPEAIAWGRTRGPNAEAQAKAACEEAAGVEPKAPAPALVYDGRVTFAGAEALLAAAEHNPATCRFCANDAEQCHEDLDCEARAMSNRYCFKHQSTPTV